MNGAGLVFIIIISIIIAFMIMCIYIKTLSVIANKLRQHFKKIGYSRGDARPESKFEICLIYCFDKTYNFSNAYMSNIIRIIKDLIRNKPVSDYSHDSSDSSSYKYPDSDIKSSLSLHTDTVSQGNKSVNQKQTEPLPL